MQRAESDLIKDRLMGRVKFCKETSYRIEIVNEEVLKGARERPDNGSDTEKFYDKLGYAKELREFVSEGFLVSTWHFNHDDAYNITEVKLTGPKGELGARWTQKYNEQGKIEEEMKYSADGSIESRRVYIYDDKGALIRNNLISVEDGIIETEEFENDRQGNKVKLTKTSKEGTGEIITTNSYDNRGNLAETTVTMVSNKRNIYTYNQAGRVAEENYYLSTGEVYRKTNYLYDENGRVNKKKIESEHLGTQLFAYQYDDKGNLIKTAEKRVEKDITFFNSMKYDQRGNEIENYLFDKLAFRYKYIYDEQGNVLEKDSFNASGELEEKFRYKYDIQSNKIEKCICNPNGSLRERYLYKYDETGKRTEKVFVGADNKVNYTIIYKYDGQNRLVEEVEQSSMTQKTTFEYNKLDLPVKIHIFGKLHELNYIKILKYDEYGNMISEFTYLPDGEAIAGVMNSYSFDKYGNWFSKVIVFNGVPEYVIEREYEYY